jgi:hypothetical protein
MLQLAILHGKKKPKDLDSFLSPIINEIRSLEKNGLVVRRFSGEESHSKVHLVLATGDIPQVSFSLLYE